MENLLKIVAEQTNQPPAPDFCFHVLVLGAEHFFTVFGKNFDQHMRLHHKSLYGKNGEFYPLATISIAAVWANLGGKQQEYDPSVFARIKEVAGTPLLPGLMGFDESKPMPISEMMDEWTWKDVREFDLPFKKSIYMSTSTSLVQNGFAKWAADRIHEIEAPLENGCKIAAQFTPLSGDCAFRRGNTDNSTSASWRDSTAFCALDVFYDVNSMWATKTLRKQRMIGTTPTTNKLSAPLVCFPKMIDD